MSQPFIEACRQRAAQFSNDEIEKRMGELLLKWSMQSTNKVVSLDHVAWIGAAIIKGAEIANTAKTETRDANGARVVGVVASDGVQVQDGAA